MSDTILSCDWGTTNVRLRRVDVASGRVLAETTAGQGAKSVHAAWRQSSGDRTTFFLDALKGLVDAIGRGASDRAAVLSGMVTSSVGMVELPYAGVPFRLDGADLSYRIVDANEFPVLLLSGMRTHEDVLRGEETELMGLHHMLGRAEAPSTYILPGTHSKHVAVEGDAVTGFSTFMTGELFDVLQRASILGGSIEEGPVDRPAFVEGVLSDRPLLNALFTVRANALFDRKAPGANFWYLSGVLVGSELRSAVRQADARIVLCATSTLAPIYGAALEALGTAERTQRVDPQLVARAAVVGHLIAYRRILGAD